MFIHYLRRTSKKSILKFLAFLKPTYGIFITNSNNCSRSDKDVVIIHYFEVVTEKSSQILINQFICSNYAKAFDFDNNEKNICERGIEIMKGINKQEVVSIPKTMKKKGFFEKLFHLFR